MIPNCTCDRCGAQSEIEQAFHRERRSFTNKWRVFCAGCWDKERMRRHRRVLRNYLVIGLLALGLLTFDRESRIGWFLASLFTLQLCVVAVVIPHELGHGCAGRLLGLRVYDLVVGLGRTIYERKLLGFRWSFKAVPFGGMAIAGHPTRKRLRLRQFFFILAGPAANAVLAALIFPFSQLGDLFVWRDPVHVANLFWFANIATLAVALWPHRTQTDRGLLSSDGLSLWRTIRMNEAEVSQYLQGYFALEAHEYRKRKDFVRAQDWIEKGLRKFPQSAVLLTLAGMNLLSLRRFREGRERFVQALATPGLDTTTRFVTLNNIAYANALIGDPDFLDEADNYSQQAIENFSWAPFAIGTRGTVLVARGEIEAGLELLRRSLAESDEPQNKALNACMLAIGERKLGNLTASEEYLKAARLLDPDCLLLDRAAPEVTELSAGGNRPS